MFVILWCLFITALCSPAGKGLTSWLLFVMPNCDFITFPCDILGQVWYLIVLISDLCHLSFFATTIIIVIRIEELELCPWDMDAPAIAKFS